MNVTRDGDYVLVQIPKRDIDSMVRFIAHQVNTKHDEFKKICDDVVMGDITKIDEHVEQLSNFLDLNNWSIVLDGPESLQLCDDLAERVYEKQPEKELNVWRICVHCHKSYLGQCACPEFKRSQLKVVK